MPAVPQNPEPHGTTEELSLKLLILRQLGVLSVLRFDVGPAAGSETSGKNVNLRPTGIILFVS